MTALTLVRSSEPGISPDSERDGETFNASSRTAPFGSTEVSYELTGAADRPVVAVLGGISISEHVTASDFDPRVSLWGQDFLGHPCVHTTEFPVVFFDYLPLASLNPPVTTVVLAPA